MIPHRDPWVVTCRRNGIVQYQRGFKRLRRAARWAREVVARNPGTIVEIHAGDVKVPVVQVAILTNATGATINADRPADATE